MAHPAEGLAKGPEEDLISHISRLIRSWEGLPVARQAPDFLPGANGAATTRVKRRLLALFPLAIILFVACGSDSSPGSAIATIATPEASATAERAGSALPSPTAAASAAIQPDGERILGYVKKLADEIGPRPAGTQKEQAAIDFIGGQLRSFGYEVSVQNFPIASEASRDATVSVNTPAPRTLAALPFERSGAGRARGTLVAAGIGKPGEFPAAVSGNIALIERGDLLFQDKVSNAVAAGARAVIIFNNDAGTFLGALSQPVSIPVVSISQNEGQALLRDLNGGNVEADVAVGTLGGSVSYNVIARPPGQECETVTGGHFDSVPQAAGASDNATGTATTLEIAGVLARAGRMGSNCFVLWGAEELGLIGSRAFVNSMSPEQRERLKAVLNLDMVGVGDVTWLLIGSADLQGQAQSLGDQLGIETRRGQLSGTTSDHASFLNAGIPALMLHRADDPLLHTPQDVSGRVRPELLEEAARLGVAFLQALATGG